MIRNLPNVITGFRLLLIPTGLLAAYKHSFFWLAFIIFISAMGDGLDGYFARKYNHITKLGALLDPLADKFLFLSLTLYFSVSKEIPLYYLVVMFSRDISLFMGVLFLIYVKKQGIVSSLMIGKISAGINFIYFIVLSLSKTSLNIPPLFLQGLYFLSLFFLIVSFLYYAYRWCFLFWLWTPVFFGVSLLLQGCSLPYIFHVGTGQLRLMEKKEPIEKVLQSGKLSPEDQKKLTYILEIRKFATEQLKLSMNNNYTEFVQLDGEAPVYNLVVCPKDKLEPYTWWFPVAGRLAYLGFFNKPYAVETRDAYEAEGYDTYLRGAAAYSTLGWFDDPIFSSMLHYDEETLSNLIIHELTHATIYKAGNTDFNEGVATFIGNVGSIAYLKYRFGKKSPHYYKAVHSEADDLFFSTFIKTSQEKLNHLYRENISIGEKIKRREKGFAEIKRSFKESKTKFKTTSYDFFEKLPLNNAVLMSFGQYYQDLSLYKQVWLKHHENFADTLNIFKQAASQDDPITFLRRL